MIEVDDNGIAYLRFGDGVLGKRPEANTQFHARYRIGEGLAGNVGAETIRRMIVRDGVQEGILDVRNPLPATGGAAPESLEDARLSAPYAFRCQPLQRAINEDDYARLAQEQFPEIQKAFAKIERSRGGRYTVHVWYDLLSGAQVTRNQINEHLQHFRRIGHVLDVKPGVSVGLTVTVHVKIKQQAIWEKVRDALKLALGEKGFFDPDQLTFKTDISLSRLVSAAQAIPGVEYVDCVEVKYGNRMETWPRVGPAGQGDTGTDTMTFEPPQIPRLARLVVKEE